MPSRGRIEREGRYYANQSWSRQEEPGEHAPYAPLVAQSPHSQSRNYRNVSACRSNRGDPRLCGAQVLASGQVPETSLAGPPDSHGRQISPSRRGYSQIRPSRRYRSGETKDLYSVIDLLADKVERQLKSHH